MTIYSFKCHRCDTVNCNKFFRCVHCRNLFCLKCLDDTNPNRLKYKVMKNDKHGIEQTIYCSKHCSKIHTFCNDCGEEYSNLRECSNCLVHYCSECHERNMGSLEEMMMPGDREFNLQIKEMSTFYCSKSCFRVHYFNGGEELNVCHNCGVVFVDLYGHGDCRKCLEQSKTDLDVKYNFNRTIYQNEITKLLEEEKITLEEIEELKNKYMKCEIEKNEFVDDNKLTFKKWIKNTSAGSSSSFMMFDKCIIKILEDKGVKLPDRESQKFKKLSPSFENGTNEVC